MAAQMLVLNVIDIYAVEVDVPARHRVEALEQLHQRGFAGTGCP